MDIDFWTALRAFLVAGGLVYAAWSVVDGDTFGIALGVFAAALGAFRLWYESDRRGANPR